MTSPSLLFSLSLPPAQPSLHSLPLQEREQASERLLLCLALSSARPLSLLLRVAFLSFSLFLSSCLPSLPPLTRSSLKVWACLLLFSSSSSLLFSSLPCLLSCHSKEEAEVARWSGGLDANVDRSLFWGEQAHSCNWKVLSKYCHLPSMVGRVQAFNWTKYCHLPSMVGQV